MIWWLCLCISLALAAFFVRVALIRRLGAFRTLYGLIGCALVSYILYLPLMLSSTDLPSAILGGIVNVLRIVSLDADYLGNCAAIREVLNADVLRTAYFILLALVHLLLPALSAMTAIALIKQCVAKYQLRTLTRSKKAVHVFSHHNPRAETLARDIRSHDPHCEILLLADSEKKDLSNLRMQLRCRIIKEKITALRFQSSRRRTHYYCICDNQEENLNAALTILSQLENKSAKEQRKTTLYIFTSDPMAEMILDSVQKGFVNINIIDQNKSAVYKLLLDHPLPLYAAEKKLHILLCGFTGVGDMLVRTAAWCGQLYDHTLKITVIGRDIENAAQTFRAKYPGLFTSRYDIQFHSYQNELEFQEVLGACEQDANYIVVAEEDAQSTADKAIRLRRFFYRADGLFQNAPPIFAYLEDEARANAIGSLQTAETNAQRRMSYGIIPFGITSRTYAFENITGSDLDILAKNVHLVYEDIFSDGPIDITNALERYHLFEVNKNSNKANAMHLRYKLLMLGLDYTDDPNAEEVELSDYLSADLLERLTYAEHNRWMAFLDSEGWEASTVAQAELYKASGISKGRHNCPLLKLHPYICPFEELAERSRQLGLPDSTVYDRDLISRIPDILHDKWNISDKKYKIIKRAPRS